MLNDTYTSRDLEATQLALHGKTVSPGCSPLPVEVRVAEAIARERDAVSRRAAAHLSALDKADVQRELVARVEAITLDAKLARAQGADIRAAELDVRASRVRYLITLFTALCLAALTGCLEQRPPPYTLYFDAEVPAADRDTFGAAASDWNVAIGEAVFIASDEPARGRCGVEVVQVERRPANSPAESFNGTCLMRIEYARGRLEPCIALHETGHRLLEGHVAGTVMDAYGCDYDAVVTPELAERVRERWGL